MRGTRTDLQQDGVERRGVSSLCRNTSEFELGGEIIRLSRKDLLNQLLILRVAVRAGLAFHFLGQLIPSAVVAWIDFNGLAPIGDGVRGIAPGALQEAAELVDPVVVGGQAAGSVEALRSGIQISLA